MKSNYINIVCLHGRFCILMHHNDYYLKSIMGGFGGKTPRHDMSARFLVDPTWDEHTMGCELL